MSELAAPDIEFHVLADGTRITVRAIKPSDKEGIRLAFERLGPRSRYQRFLTATARLTDEMLRYLTEVDGVNHVALLAVTDSLDLKEDVGLGVARFVRLPEEPEVAEAAIVVSDEVQGKGIGRILLQALSRAARERGIRVFRGEVLASNAAMRRLLDDAGARVVGGEGESLIFDVPIAERDEEGDQTLRKILRVVAEWVASLPLLRVGPNSHADEMIDSR